MKAGYFAVLATLLIIFLFWWKSFLGSVVEEDRISNSEVKSDNLDHASGESIQISAFACVAGVVVFILCFIAYFLWKCQAGKVLSMWKCMDARSRETEYTRIKYSDDEESRVGSPISDVSITKTSVKSVILPYIRWLLSLPFFKIRSKNSTESAHRIEPRGLENIGNTCYFNSAMQVLANTYILHTSIQENTHSGEFNQSFEGFCKWVRLGSSSRWNLWNLLCSFIKQYKELPEMHSIFSSRARRFSNYEQHDSHECLRHVLDELRKDERDCLKKILDDERKCLTVVDKVFGGHFITAYICMKCGEPYHLFEPFLDISLPICLGSDINGRMAQAHTADRNPVRNLQEYATAVTEIMTRLTDPVSYEHRFPQSPYSLNDCLWYFTRTEHIQDEYLCRHCYSKYVENGGKDVLLTSATKQTLIFNPPAVITIHLKRFELKPGKSEKRNDRIRYDELLDIAPYCSKYCLRNDPPESNLWYFLYGIVVHSGSLEFGHYVAYIKVRDKEPDTKKYLQEEYFNREKTNEQLIEMMQQVRRERFGRSSWDAKANEGIWYCMNDAWVSEVTVNEVLNQEAYLLLYERI